MRQTTETFRSRYRAEIHPFYNPWLHGAFVLLFGLLAIAAFTCGYFYNQQISRSRGFGRTNLEATSAMLR